MSQSPEPKEEAETHSESQLKLIETSSNPSSLPNSATYSLMSTTTRYLKKVTTPLFSQRSFISKWIPSYGPSVPVKEPLGDERKKPGNMILPAYSHLIQQPHQEPRPSTLGRVWKLFQSYFPSTQKPLQTLVNLVTEKPFQVRKVVIIGIHGWFPNKLLQRVVGEPQGTSQRLAEKMREALMDYFNTHYSMTLQPDQVVLIPLEGEGKIEDRVDVLYRQLMDGPPTLLDPKGPTPPIDAKGWVQHLVESDMILVAAHSQGTPVSVLILSKLIEQGIINLARTRVCLCALAGISHGPFPNLKSSVIIKYVEADAARELFAFNDGDSRISRLYQSQLIKILNEGVKIVPIASWYDQVVPLYSALMHGIHHPLLYRAIFIYGPDYAPDFLCHLVVFLLKLRNKGLHDHHLLVYLSDTLAGNVYGFGTQGHSQIYEEVDSYRLAVAWCMGHTPTHGRTNDHVTSRPFHAPVRLNPYYIPFIMAQLLSDKQIQKDKQLKQELDELMKMFVAWEPSVKSFKDLKYRLEPIRSKL